MMGFANLTFAGGRETITHSISSIIHHLGTHPQDLDELRSNQKGLVLAGFFRSLMPLTLLEALTAQVAAIAIKEASPHQENQSTYQRQNGFDSLTVKFTPSPASSAASNHDAASS